MKELISLAAQSHAQKQIVLFLREYFSKQPDELFKWHKNQAETRINITTQYNDTQRMQIPTILVDEVSGDIWNRTIGQEMITEIKEEKEVNGKPRIVTTGYNLHGFYTLTCTIRVIDYNASSRRLLIDLVCSALRHIGIHALKKQNIELSKITLETARYDRVGNQFLQIQPIRVDFMTNWNKRVNDFDRLKQILIKEIYLDNTLDVATDPDTGKQIKRTVTIPRKNRRKN